MKVMEEKDREIALLNEQMAKLQHTETAPDNKVTPYTYTLDRPLVLLFTYIYIFVIVDKCLCCVTAVPFI